MGFVFGDLTKDWLAEKSLAESMGELSYGTFRNYRGYAANYFIYFADRDVRSICRDDLVDFKRKLRGVSIKTRRNVMAALASVFKWMSERGIVTVIPRFPRIKGDDAKIRVAIDQEVQEKGLRALYADQRDIFEFLMETGLRPSEACALVCKDVNIVAGILSVERTFTGKRLRKSTKQNRKGIIPLSDRAKEIAERNLKEKGVLDFLFINPRTDNHYLGDTLGRIWRQQSGTGVTLYEATRHSFASQLIEDNDVVHVRDLLRHSDIRSTAKYAHVRVRKLREIVNNRRKAVVG